MKKEKIKIREIDQKMTELFEAEFKNDDLIQAYDLMTRELRKLQDKINETRTLKFTYLAFIELCTKALTRKKVYALASDLEILAAIKDFKPLTVGQIYDKAFELRLADHGSVKPIKIEDYI